MNWSILGKLVVQSIPAAIKFANNLKGKSGKEKLDASVVFSLEEIKDISDITGKAILNDPRVIDAVKKAHDATVEVQIVISKVEAEQGNN